MNADTSHSRIHTQVQQLGIKKKTRKKWLNEFLVNNDSLTRKKEEEEMEEAMEERVLWIHFVCASPYSKNASH